LGSFFNDPAPNARDVSASNEHQRRPCADQRHCHSKHHHQLEGHVDWRKRRPLVARKCRQPLDLRIGIAKRQQRQTMRNFNGVADSARVLVRYAANAKGRAALRHEL